MQAGTGEMDKTFALMDELKITGLTFTQRISLELYYLLVQITWLLLTYVTINSNVYLVPYLLRILKFCLIVNRHRTIHCHKTAMSLIPLTKDSNSTLSEAICVFIKLSCSYSFIFSAISCSLRCFSHSIWRLRSISLLADWWIKNKDKVLIENDDNWIQSQYFVMHKIIILLFWFSFASF